jgi:hypothetical protein
VKVTEPLRNPERFTATWSGWPALVTFAKAEARGRERSGASDQRRPGIVIFSGRTPILAITLHLVDGVIKTVHVVSNPEKLTGVVQ